MEWSRIPTALLTDRVPERDLIAVIKYQLLWAYQEQEPSDELARRYLTADQLKRVQPYRESMAKMVRPDINSLVLKRGRDKKNYYKSKGLDKNPTDEKHDGTTDGTPSALTDHIIEQRREKSEKIKIEEKIQDHNRLSAGDGIGLGQGYRGFKGIAIPPFWKKQNGE